VLFKDADNCLDYIASMIDEGISIEHWWHYTDSGNLKYSEKTLSHCYLSHHKPHMDWHGMEAVTHHLTYSMAMVL